MHIKIQYNAIISKRIWQSLQPYLPIIYHVIMTEKMMSEHNLPADIVIVWSTNVFSVWSTSNDP